MKRIRAEKLIGLAVAAAFAVPISAAAETVLPQYPQANSAGSKLITEEGAQQPAPYYEQAQSRQSSARASAPDLVVVTITPLAQPMVNERQRRESTFRALDSSGDGEVSMAEAGVNTQLLNAFQRVDRDGNRVIDRQEFARVHVDDGQKSAPASSPSSASQQAQSRQQAQSQQDASAAAGGSREQAGALDRNPDSPLPSRNIEERARFSYPGESVPPNTPGQPSR
jgi:hypothetical protein